MLHRPRGRAIRAAALILTPPLLGGCATFGSNVKGSFSCTAPDGICAPSSSIDDRALAMIAGEGAIGEPSPASSNPARRVLAKPARTAASGQVLPAPQVDARRTQERVLRIVFQPYIDERGRLHEVTAVHAVVQGGEWQQQTLANATPIPEHNAFAVAPQAQTLVDAVGRAELPDGVAGVADPNQPDPAVVAAARARAVDPIKAIQNDVAARLAPKAGRTPALPAIEMSKRRAETRSVEGTAPVAPVTAAKATGTPEGKAEPVEAATPAISARTTVTGEAVARVKASPEYKARTAQTESDARAAAQAATVPSVDAKVQPTVRAAGFPAAVREEN